MRQRQGTEAARATARRRRSRSTAARRGGLLGPGLLPGRRRSRPVAVSPGRRTVAAHPPRDFAGGGASRRSRPRGRSPPGRSTRRRPRAAEPAEGVGRVAPGGLALDLARGPPGERGLAGEDLAEDRAQPEDVGPLVERRPRRGPARGPCRRACRARSRPARRSPSEPLRAVWITVSLVVGWPASASSAAPPSAQDLGQAPVHHLDLAERADHDVRGLQVAVDHAAGVGIGHRLADLLEDREEPGQVVGRGSALGEERRPGSGP